MSANNTHTLSWYLAAKEFAVCFTTYPSGLASPSLDRAKLLLAVISLPVLEATVPATIAVSDGSCDSC